VRPEDLTVGHRRLDHPASIADTRCRQLGSEILLDMKSRGCHGGEREPTARVKVAQLRVPSPFQAHVFDAKTEVAI